MAVLVDKLSNAHVNSPRAADRETKRQWLCPNSEYARVLCALKYTM